MAHQVKISSTGKHVLSDVSSEQIGRLLVHIPAGSTISMTFAGRPRHESLTASDDVTLGYYTPDSDTLATAAFGTAPGQVYVKTDGNLVFANVASVTGTVILTVEPLLG